MIGYSILMLAGAQAIEPVSASQPPAEPLICRYDAPINTFISGRRMCLTAAEWEKRARHNNEAARKMLYDYMGNTNCLDNGICTDL